MTSRPSTSVSFIRGLTFCFVFMSSIFLTCFMCAQAAPRTSLNFSRLHVFKSEEGVSLKGVVSNGDGWLFGTAAYGGSNNSGTFFKMREDGRDFKVLHSFGVAKSKKPGESSFANQFNDDGMRPIGCLVQGSNEFLYGLTSEGGSYNNGTLYRVRKDGSRFETLYTFAASKGRYSFASPNILFLARDGWIYGAALQGGDGDRGLLFKIQADGLNFTPFYTFKALDEKGNSTTGTQPSSLTLGRDGNLHGTTQFGGAFRGGTVFRVSTSGKRYKVLHAFGLPNPEADGPAPSSLTFAPDGFLYRTTRLGGPQYGGTVFKMTPLGQKFQVLHHFALDARAANGREGREPYGNLHITTSGWIYGVTRVGGAPDPYVGNGTMYKMKTDGTAFSIVYAVDHLENADVSHTPITMLPPQSADFIYGLSEPDSPHFLTLFSVSTQQLVPKKTGVFKPALSSPKSSPSSRTP